MVGLAQKLYCERTNNRELPHKDPSTASRDWPLLKHLLDKGFITYIDYALAESLLQEYPEANESVAALLCYLSQASRMGHLCVKITQNTMTPPIDILWRRALMKEGVGHNDKDTAQLIKTYEAMILNAPKSLPNDLVYIEGSDMDLEKALCRWNDYFYFQKYWSYEISFVEHLRRIRQAAPHFQPNPALLDEEIENLLKNKRVLPEQADAIRKGCLNNFSILCGGPGTGKTYTAGIMIDTFLKTLPDGQRHKCRIALAAPTGKAAANLQKSLMRSCKMGDEIKISAAQTLHSLLGIGKQGAINSSATIQADLILIDESSMIDAQMIAKLFAAIRSGTKLIMLGDPHQLPPVESGLFFGDLVDLKKGPLEGQVSTLTKCLRAELEAIVNTAEAVKKGDWLQFKHLLKDEASKTTVSCDLYEEGCSSYEIQKNLLAKALPHIPFHHKSGTTHEELLEIFNHFKILTPLRKGPFGVDTLNALIKEAIGKKLPKGTPLIAPILIVSNDYRLELFNGETGVLIKQDAKDEKLGKGDIVLFPGRNLEEESVRILPALLLPKFEYAYAMSVYKSQGSEFDHVVIFLPDGSSLLGRDVLYTGATRAKKRLEIVSTETTLKTTIEQHTKRFSCIFERLQ